MSSQRLLTVAMTDLVGSTETVARLGPATGERWRQQHIGVLRGALLASRGRELQMLGDGLLAAFESASAAVDFATAAQRRVALANARRDALAEMGLRVGIAVGEGIEDDEGVHGLVVVEASRLCASARGGQVVASALVQALCAVRTELRFTALGALALKGLPAPVNAVELAWQDAGASSDVPLPVTLAMALRSDFVGRANERDRLHAALLRASAGERVIATLAGEPGIGKTRLAAEIAKEAAAKGTIVLHGRCDEDLSAPFQPWVQALRHYLAHASPGGFAAEDPSAAAVLARLLPELEPHLSGAEARESDPESERMRVFEAVDALLAFASRAAPVLVVLDDLHWADKPSLVLLRHLAHSPQSAALLLLGTYRDVDLARTHPLAETLADLRRGTNVERVPLRGLDEPETVLLLESRAAHAVPAAFVRALHAETAGNPFFVEEVLRHLAETGALRKDGERWTSDRRIDQLGIPEGVREVVGRRLSRLSDAANQALAVAAVIGRDFDAQTIDAAGGPSGDALLDALDEAERAQLIQEVAGAAGRYAFAHALVRQTLYQELGTTRRVRLHWRIGVALEKRHASALDGHQSAIAHHLSEGVLAGDPLRAVDSSLRAARRATALVAHEEVIVHTRRALALLDQAGLDEPERRYELLMTLGEALIHVSGEYRLAFFDAAAIARRRGWVVRDARAVIEATMTTDFAVQGQNRQLHELEQALAALPPADGPERCKLIARLASILNFSDFARGQGLADEALRMARRLGGADELAVALGVALTFLFGAPRVAEMEAVCREATEIGQRSSQPGLAVFFAFNSVIPSLLRGERAAFECGVAAVDAACERVRSARLTSATLRALDELASGRFDEARRIAAAARKTAGTQLAFQAIVAAARFEAGRFAEVSASAEQFAANLPAWGQTYRCVAASARASLGQLDEARSLFEELSRDDFHVLRRDWGWPLSLRHLAETCALTDSVGGARRLEPHLAPYSGLFLSPFLVTHLECAADRALGQVLATQGRLDEAVDRYTRALALEEGFGAAALAARTRYWWARALLERGTPGDAERARTLASECVATTSAVGMTHLESSARALLR